MTRYSILLIDSGGELLFDTVSNATLARTICSQRNRIDREAQPPRRWDWRELGQPTEPPQPIPPAIETQSVLL